HSGKHDAGSPRHLPSTNRPASSLTGKTWSVPDLGFDDEQTLEVVTLGKLERDRMVGGGAEALDDLGIRAGVERRAGDDRLEELGRHAARAGEGGEQASRREQLEREQVDVLVSAGG